MWSIFILGLLAGLTSAEYAWTAGTQYNYVVRARTLTGLHQVSNQFSGMFMKAKLIIKPISDAHISVTVSDCHVADINANMSNGWDTHIPDDQLNFQPLLTDSRPFELHFKDGIVEKMMVDKNLPTWHINMIKSIASQLQIDTSANQLKKSHINKLPTDQEPMGVYKSIEGSITGKCETLYDVSPLALYILQSRPELAPLPHLRAKGQIIEIVKTQNYSNCQQRMSYHFGITGMTQWEPASNMMGHFMARNNVARIVISGTLKQYTVQSSVATNKIILSPHVYNNQKGIVVSRMNLTLQSVMSTSETPESLTNPRVINNLVYEYNPAGQINNMQTYDAYVQNLNTESENDNLWKKVSGVGNNLNNNEDMSTFSKLKEEKSGKFLWFGRNDDPTVDKTENKGQAKRNDSESSSESDISSMNSNEEFLQSRPSLNMPSNVPFLSYFVGFQGNSIQASNRIDTVSIVTKIANEVAIGVQNPNSITGKNILTKFDIITRILRTMSSKQLEEVANELYSPPSKNNGSSNQNNHAWIVLRDSIAQAGTGPALILLKQWIHEEKVTGEEAAELLAVLPNSAHYPTSDYMDVLFSLVTSPVVKNQKYLNTTAILSLSDLVRRAIVSKTSAHNRYPVHSFGYLAAKNETTFLNSYIDYLTEELKRSVSEGNSPNIQVYIRALGNVAHYNILNVFEPYLEGRIPMSNFQRLVLVASLDRMTKVYPNQARSILYKAYQNIGNTDEVRIAAVMQLMKTNPPAQILQRMAAYTNYEASKQVNSAVKSAILSAAELTTPQSYQLSENAQSAVHMLNTKEYNYEYSKHYIRAYVVDQQNLGYKQDFTYIQSKNSIIPSSIFYYLRRQMGGYKLQYKQLALMTSSSDDLIDMLSNQFNSIGDELQGLDSIFQTNSQPNSKWSSNKIAKMLNIEIDDPQQLEGNIILGFFGGNRFYSFDNHTMEELFNKIEDTVATLADGQQFNNTKMYNQFSMDIGFPTVTGLPFIYSISIPTVVQMSGEYQGTTKSDIRKQNQGKVQIPDVISVSTGLNFMYSIKTQSNLGFITPFNHQHYITGLEKNTHINIPLRIWSNINLQNKTTMLKLEPLKPREEEKIFEYSTSVYTTIHDIFQLTPPLEDNKSNLIHIRPLKRYEMTVGQENTGFAFNFKLESEQKFVDIASVINGIRRYDWISAWLYPYAERNINNNNITLSYNPRLSTAKHATFYLLFGLKKSSSNEEQEFNQRQNKLIRDAESLVKNSTTIILDASLEFSGQKKVEYATTIAYASSMDSQKSRLLLSFNKNTTQSSKSNQYQFAADIKMKMPQQPTMNFKEALKLNKTSHINAKISFGENNNLDGRMELKGNFKTSPERKTYIRQSTMGQQCEKEMQNGNYILPACLNSISAANMRDNFSFDWKCEKISDYTKKITNKVYTFFSYLGYDFFSENIHANQNSDENYQADIKYDTNFNVMNVSINGPTFNANFSNVRLNQWIKPYYLMHPKDKIIHEYGTCILDQTSAVTLDNRTYPINLGQCWHVILQTIPKFWRPDSVMSKKVIQFSVLVRDNSFGQRDLKILMEGDVIDILPSNHSTEGIKGTAYVNGQKIKIDPFSITQLNTTTPIGQIWSSVLGEIILYSPKYGVEIIYDRFRVKLKVASSYHGKVYGLCGTFTRDPITDFTAPRNCIMKNPFEFAASYAIVDGSCHGPARELQQRAQNAQCYKVAFPPADIEEVGHYIKPMRTESNMFDNSPANLMGCTNHKIQVLLDEKQICFSIRPQIVCGSNCQPSSTIEKMIDFHCVADTIVSRHWLEMVKKGANPDFSQKSSNKRASFKLAEKCAKK